MPYDIDHDPVLRLEPQDPPYDPGRIGRLQAEYINDRWKELFDKIEGWAQDV